MAIGGLGVFVLLGRAVEGGGDGVVCIIALLSITLLHCIALIFGFFGLTMVVFWLFAGIVLGFWYVFGGYNLGYLTSEVNLMIIFLSSMTLVLFFLEDAIRYYLKPSSKTQRGSVVKFFELVGVVVAQN
jgi:hypothetical protein